MFQILPSDSGLWRQYYERCRPTARYCMQTEVHVYALAIAASVMLSFYPFLSVMRSFCRYVLHMPAAVQAINLAMSDYLPGYVAEFVQNNPPHGGRLQLFAMFLLLVTANGIFEPLEVAFNKAWGVTRNRSYLKNQLVSLGMIFLCGILALASLILTALNLHWIEQAGGYSVVSRFGAVMFFKIAAMPISIVGLFLVYWLLPNRKIAPRAVAPVAILVGMGLEALKYVNLLIWPLLQDRLKREYGVFFNSVTVLLWSFIAAMIVLAGAEWAARRSLLFGPPSNPIS